ncbi:hypothetical protein lerEdw1_018479 [Lerista edwardsae]|nr:hypothetical protein lerEdw1_018479 [Lerista edwardsae]
MYEDRKNVVIAKIDITANEVLLTNLEHYPFFRFFPAGSETEVVPYRGERTLDAFVQYLEDQIMAWKKKFLIQGLYKGEIKSSLQVFFVLSKGHCSDCHLNAACEQNHRCVCQEGFSGDGLSCSDVDECASPDLNHCHSLATCANHHGNYSCSCPDGYSGDGFHCEVVRLADKCSQGSRSCPNPCTTHSVLNQYWRSTSYGSGANCDKDKIGWYRFVGSGGERMPETCVPSNKCNTNASMWLKGSHPTTTVGTVTRTACASWLGDCCQWSSTVEIKACPGGYYVYRLYGTPECYLSYCTDPKFIGSPCPECGEEEECQLVNGDWGCYCREEYNNTDLSSLEPQLECGANEIKVSMDKCLLNKMGFKKIIMHLKDYSCAGFEEQRNETVVSVVTPTHNGQCGTQLTRNETHATYSNTLYLANGSVVRENEIQINFHCSYPLDMEISLETAIQPMVSSINISVGGTGTFTVKMALYRDTNYTSPYEGSMAVLSAQARLYVGVMVTRGDLSQFVLRMEHCYATPTSNASDPLKYFIIQNSCPNPADSTITVPENGVSARGQFSLQVFKFVGNYPLLYLHCDIQLCDNSTQDCQPDCSGIRSRRAAAVETEYSLHLGPVVREGYTSLVGSAASHGSQGVWMTLLIPAVISFSLHAFP